MVKSPGRSLSKYEIRLIKACSGITDRSSKIVSSVTKFFYVKDETHVHPALGRIAFLLPAYGVKLHVLTDADSELNGLRPDNEIEQVGHRRGPAAIPLKENDWNQLELNLVGDQLRLKLNGVEICEAPVAAWNQRQFGLFHYAKSDGRSSAKRRLSRRMAEVLTKPERPGTCRRRCNHRTVAERHSDAYLIESRFVEICHHTAGTFVVLPGLFRSLESST